MKASYRQGNAVVEYDPALVTPAAMVEAIRSATYYQVGEPVPGTPVAQVPESRERLAANSTAVISVKAMTDDRAASRVLAAMGRPDAIAGARVDLAGTTVTVEYDGAKVSAETLVAAIDQGTPYRAELVSKSERDETVPAKSSGADSAGPNYLLWISIGVGSAIALASGAVLARQRMLSKTSRAARRRRKQ